MSKTNYTPIRDRSIIASTWKGATLIPKTFVAGLEVAIDMADSFLEEGERSLFPAVKDSTKVMVQGSAAALARVSIAVEDTMEENGWDMSKNYFTNKEAMKKKVKAEQTKLLETKPVNSVPPVSNNK